MSALAAVVGLGMVACVLAFFASPMLGAGAFVVAWVVAALGIVGYHLMNAVSKNGVPLTTYGFEGAGEAGPTRHADRLRELERLRADGLVSDDECRRKRADSLNENW